MEDQLVKDNIKLIYFVLNKYNLLEKEDEYFDVGLVGLARGIKTFDESKGFALSTYLTKCITSEVLTYRKMTLRKKRGSGDTPISLYTRLSFEDDEFYLIDIISSNENVEKTVMDREKLEFLYREISKLDDMGKYIICSFYGLMGHEQLQGIEIAKKLGLSKLTVCRIKNKIINEIRRKYD